MENHESRFRRTPYLWAVTILFSVWSALFIYMESVDINGVRHYALFDDAYIVMRYAWNLSHGFGLVWNPGVRVEGFTSPLMTLYMSIGTALFDKNGAVLFVQISGVGFMLGTAYMCMRIAGEIFRNRTPGTRDFLMVLSFAAALAYYPLTYFSLNGMENGLLALLLLSATWIAIRSDGKPKMVLILPILMGLTFLTRPDALVPVAIIIIYRFAGIWRKERWLRILLGEIAILGVFVVSVSLFRWIYYGEIVPNTYTLKLSGMPLAFRIHQGWDFLKPFWGPMMIPILLALLNLVLNFRKITLLLMMLFVSAVAYQIYVGGDVWPPYWRMMAPFVPLLFILCIEAVWDILSFCFMSNVVNKYLSRAPVLRRLLLDKIAAVAIVFLLLLSVNWVFRAEVALRQPSPEMAMEKMGLLIATAISELTGPDATLAVFGAGARSYYTGLKSIDCLGYSDKYIAHLPPDLSGAVSWGGMKSIPGHNKYDLNYSIVEQRPTCVERFTWGNEDVSKFGQQNYVQVTRWGFIKLWFLKDSKDVLWEKILSGQ